MSVVKVVNGIIYFSGKNIVHVFDVNLLFTRQKGNCLFLATRCLQNLEIPSKISGEYFSV